MALNRNQPKTTAEAKRLVDEREASQRVETERADELHDVGLSQEPQRAGVRTIDLELATKTRLADFTISQPFTLLFTGREASATTTMLTLSGRSKAKSGTVELITKTGEVVTQPRKRARHIALAGVGEIDSLDRNLTVRSLIRETVAWSNKWYQRTPGDVSQIESWVTYSELIGLQASPKSLVGELNPPQRFQLRVILGLLARPDADMVLIDDIDQVQSLEIRGELLESFGALSRHVPVVVASSNTDSAGQCDETINLEAAEESEHIDTTEASTDTKDKA